MKDSWAGRLSVVIIAKKPGVMHHLNEGSWSREFKKRRREKKFIWLIHQRESNCLLVVWPVRSYFCLFGDCIYVVGCSDWLANNDAWPMVLFHTHQRGGSRAPKNPIWLLIHSEWWPCVIIGIPALLASQNYGFVSLISTFSRTFPTFRNLPLICPDYHWGHRHLHLTVCHIPDQVKPGL